MASLFVKNLHPNVTESILYKKFSSIGPLLSLKVCRETGTNRPLGYAYVNYVEQTHANRAIETMNFDLLEGKPIRLMRSERNPLLRKIGEPNVFVKNLDQTVTDRELFITFSQFGKVLTCKVAQDRNGISKCYGFIQFENDESAMRSIEQLNGFVFNSKILCVKRFTKQQMKGSRMHLTATPNQAFTNVYIKNIGNEVSDQKLKEMFEQFGKIVSCKVMTDSEGNNRGFGFVSFEKSEAALNSTLQLNGQIFSNGKPLYVNRAQTKLERALAMRSRQEEFKEYHQENLYVSNLDDTIDDDRLQKEFQYYGTILSAKVIMNEGRSIGFGYVCFSRSEESKKAISALNGRIVGTKPIIVSLAENVGKKSFAEERLQCFREKDSFASQSYLSGVADTMYQGNEATNILESLVPKTIIQKRKHIIPILPRMLATKK